MIWKEQILLCNTTQKKKVRFVSLQPGHKDIVICLWVHFKTSLEGIEPSLLTHWHDSPIKFHVDTHHWPTLMNTYLTGKHLLMLVIQSPFNYWWRWRHRVNLRSYKKKKIPKVRSFVFICSLAWFCLPHTICWTHRTGFVDDLERCFIISFWSPYLTWHILVEPHIQTYTQSSCLSKTGNTFNTSFSSGSWAKCE